MDGPRVKNIFLSIVILTFFFAFTLFQYSFEGQFSKTVSPGSTPTFAFRDVSQPFTAPTVSLDQSLYQIGDTAT